LIRENTPEKGKGRDFRKNSLKMNRFSIRALFTFQRKADNIIGEKDKTRIAQRQKQEGI